MTRLRRPTDAGVPAGPPVLVEAAVQDDSLLPNAEDGALMKRWGTTLLDVNAIKASGGTIDKGREQIMALQDLIADDSQVFELRKSGTNHARHVCIGRAKRNDIVLIDDTISSLHATFIGGEVQVLNDNRSSNGTWVNQQPVKAPMEVPLRSGDCIRLGRRVFYYLSGEHMHLLLKLRRKRSG